MQIEGEVKLLNCFMVTTGVEKHFPEVVTHHRRERIQLASSFRLGNRVIELAPDGKIVGISCAPRLLTSSQPGRTARKFPSAQQHAIVLSAIPSQCYARDFTFPACLLPPYQCLSRIKFLKCRDLLISRHASHE